MANIGNATVEYEVSYFPSGETQTITAKCAKPRLRKLLMTEDITAQEAAKHLKEISYEMEPEPLDGFIHEARFIRVSRFRPPEEGQIEYLQERLAQKPNWGILWSDPLDNTE